MDYLPTSFVFSNVNVISIFLVKELLAKSSRVIVITNERHEFAKYFPKNENLIFKDFRERINEVPSYVFLIQGFSHRDSFFSKLTLKTILNFSEAYAPKTQVILPYTLNTETRRKIEGVAHEAKKIKNRNLSIIYLGEIYGAGMDLFNFTWTSSLFRNLWQGTNLFIPAYDVEFYLIGIGQVIEVLIKGIFSYGFNKKENVLAFKKDAFQFLRELQEIRPDVNFVTHEKITPPATISNFDLLPVAEEKNTLRETVLWIEKNKQQSKKNSSAAVGMTKRLTKVRIDKRKARGIGFVLLATIFVLSLPFVTFLFSVIILKAGFEKLGRLDLESANSYFQVSSDLATFSKITFIFSQEGQKMSTIIDDFGGFGKDLVLTFNLGQKLEQNIADRKSTRLNSSHTVISYAVFCLKKKKN